MATNTAAPAPLASTNAKPAAASITNGAGHARSSSSSAMPNGTHPISSHDHRPAPTPTPAMNSSKKVKGKKALDTTETSKLLAARITQLEGDTAAEREQELEIDREVKKATREMNSQMSRMTELERIDHLTKKSVELLASMKRLERDNNKNKKRADQLQKEKDTSRSDLSKQIGLKEKLEKLCRELQRDNNKLKSENRTVNDSYDRHKTSSDERYKILFETLEGFQETKNNPPKQVMDMKVEELFKARFKSMIDQYELRDLHWHSLMRTKEIEVQWHMGRYEEQKRIAESEAGKSHQLETQVRNFTKTETELRQQLNVYVDKFKQVEDTLNNSNDLFLTFRREMEGMSKKSKKLEKENTVLRRKNNEKDMHIGSMAVERTKFAADLDDVRKKNETLRSIIQQMQQQGRGIPNGMQATVDSCAYTETNHEHHHHHHHHEHDHDHDHDHDGDIDEEEEDDDDESEYEYDDEDGEEGSGAEFDDDTEEEPQSGTGATTAITTNGSAPQPFGPERPPTTTPVPATNGHR